LFATLILRNNAPESVAYVCASGQEDTKMPIAKRISGLAIAVLVATVSLAPTNADARGARFVTGAFAGFAAGALFGAAIGGWGPYPYRYGYPAPVYFPPAPYYGPYAYYGYGGCGQQRHRPFMASGALESPIL
jgi:hypothetical protein